MFSFEPLLLNVTGLLNALAVATTLRVFYLYLLVDKHFT